MAIEWWGNRGFSTCWGCWGNPILMTNPTSGTFKEESVVLPLPGSVGLTTVFYIHRLLCLWLEAWATCYDIGNFSVFGIWCIYVPETLGINKPPLCSIHHQVASRMSWKAISCCSRREKVCLSTGSLLPACGEREKWTINELTQFVVLNHSFRGLRILTRSHMIHMIINHPCSGSTVVTFKII
jgi:hypothetical protein